jgi:hypothetical protein
MMPRSFWRFATVVDFWDQTAQAFSQRCWLSTAPGHSGWRNAGTFADASTNLVDSTKGLAITLRTGVGAQTLWLTGAIPTNAVTQIIQNNGYTLAASRFPLTATLDSLTNGFVGGTSLVTSDQLLFYDPATQGYPVKVWRDAAGQVWRNADGSLATTNLVPGQAILIKRRNRAGHFLWTNSPPYNVGTVFP